MKILWENPVLFFLRNSDSTNGNRCAGFCPRGYVSVAEAVSSTDVEDNKSGADEVQELLPEMRKGEEKEEHFRRRRLHANPGIGSRKHRVLRRRQVKIEAEAWELTTKEYKELLKDMCEHKLAPNLPFMKSLFLGWFEPFTDAIAKEQELIRTGKSRQGYAPYFDLLPADKMSVISMHQLAAMVMTGGEHGCARVATAACMIGDAIEQEALDTLGNTRWRVNKRVLSVVDRTWSNGCCLADLVDHSDVKTKGLLLPNMKWIEGCQSQRQRSDTQKCNESACSGLPTDTPVFYHTDFGTHYF